jgi:methionyl-tRNA synthetase
MTAKKFKRTLVTSALPYANGPIHLGHLAGVYVPSDIYVRYLRQRGRDVISICGSDEHGVPITLKARNEGIAPQEVVDRYHALNKKAFEDFGISFDIYSRTSNQVHHETASEFFKILHEKGFSWKSPRNNIMMKRRVLFWPTATLPAPVPIAEIPLLMATSASNVAPP